MFKIQHIALVMLFKAGATACTPASEQRAGARAEKSSTASKETKDQTADGKGKDAGSEQVAKPKEANAEGATPTPESAAQDGKQIADSQPSDGSDATKTTTETATETAIDEHPTIGEVTPLTTYEKRIEDRALGDILCQDGPRVAAGSGDDFSTAFAAVCSGDKPNATYAAALSAAYAGTGDPEVMILKANTDDSYNTSLVYVYAVKIPLDTPNRINDLNLYGAFADGLKDQSSTMNLAVESRQAFPGKGSVEQVILNYDLKLADGAAMYDKRRSEVQNYIPSEATRDITLSTEILLDGDKNAHYHAARQLVVGLKNDDQTTTLLYINDMVVKNRIDPARLQRTLVNLAKVLAKKTYDTAKAKNN